MTPKPFPLLPLLFLLLLASCAAPDGTLPAVEGLYTLSVSTTALPNQAALELYASAIDGSGEVGASAPVAVRTDHPGAPALTYLVAYTLPKPPAYGTPCPKPSASPSTRLLPHGGQPGRTTGPQPLRAAQEQAAGG